MAFNDLSLSLQFGKLADPAPHRAALPRHSVARWIRHALQSDAEITVLKSVGFAALDLLAARHLLAAAVPK